MTAAFINNIAEEGNRAEALYWMQKQRRDNGMDILDDSDFDGWTKDELVAELSRLWHMVHPTKGP